MVAHGQCMHHTGRLHALLPNARLCLLGMCFVSCRRLLDGVLAQYAAEVEPSIPRLPCQVRRCVLR